MPQLFALADCNNFYASCERLFAPRLEGHPIVVLSNNDGCVIARSNEAKALGIPMGTPFFKIAALAKAGRVAVFSSNYMLYGDLSRRVMATLSRFAPRSEVYSIDECFLDLSDMPPTREFPTMTDYATHIAQTTKRWTGIPVSIGLAPTKTLAKLANHIAKKGIPSLNIAPALAFDWTTVTDPDALLRALPTSEVWGVGRRLAPKLQALGIHTVYDLKTASAKHIRKEFGVTLERTLCELNGLSCFDLEDVPPPHQQIMVSRSFGQRLTAYEDILPAVATFAARAGEKLRKQQLYAPALGVFIHTNPHDKTAPYFANSTVHTFSQPTQNSSLLVSTARQLLRSLFRPHQKYQKAGVFLPDLTTTLHGAVQPSLFDLCPAADTQKSEKLMATLDALNARFGSQTLRFAAQDLDSKWQTRANNRSPAYTTRWDEIPSIRLFSRLRTNKRA